MNIVFDLTNFGAIMAVSLIIFFGLGSFLITLFNVTHD